MKGREPWRWYDVRNRNLGTWAYAINRLSGIGLTVYLFLHLGVLTTLIRGPEAWDAFVALAKAPPVLLMDVLLLGGLAIHGLNGVRLVLNALGIGVQHQKAMFLVIAAVSVVLTAIGGYLIFFME
jgi:succinate dehydrogenase / fumarate reductase cytochrome b subunit